MSLTITLAAGRPQVISLDTQRASIQVAMSSGVPGPKGADGGGGTGGGAVDSVNGKIGVVVLVPADIGAEAERTYTGTAIGADRTLTESIAALDSAITVVEYVPTTLVLGDWGLVSGDVTTLDLLSEAGAVLSEPQGAMSNYPEIQFDGVEKLTNIHFHYRYYVTSGAPTSHSPYFRIWNVTLSQWEQLSAVVMVNSTLFEVFNKHIEVGPDYITTDTDKRVRVQFYHAENGNSLHRIAFKHSIASSGPVAVVTGGQHDALGNRDLPNQHPGTAIALTAPDGTGNLPDTVTDVEALKVAVDTLVLGNVVLVAELPTEPVVGTIYGVPSADHAAPTIITAANQSFLASTGLANEPITVQDFEGYVDSLDITFPVNESAFGLTAGGTGTARTYSVAAGAAKTGTVTIRATTLFGMTAQQTISLTAASQLFTITTSAGANGTIEATQQVAQGGSITITATPDAGYSVASLTLDAGTGGETVITGETEWTFTNVQANHTIAAAFVYTVATVDTFTIGTPLGLGVQITAFTHTNATFYMFTETATPPLEGDGGWLAVPPEPFGYVASGAGDKTVYPWVKSALGAVSAVFGSPRTATFAAYPVSVVNGAGVYSAATALTALVANSGTLSQTAFDTISVSGGTADNNFAALRTAATGQIYTRELEVTARTAGANRTGYTYICPTSFTPATTDVAATFIAASKFAFFLGNAGDANDGKVYARYTNGAGTAYYLQSDGTWATGLYIFAAPIGNPRFKVQKDATNYTVSLLNGDGSVIKSAPIAISSVRTGTSDDYLVFGDVTTDGRNVMTYKVRS